MDASELATKMLDWEFKKRELDALGAQIKDAVLEIGKTQTVGNCRATYSRGRRSFDYKSAAEGEVDGAVVELFTKMTVSTDWKAICEHVGIEDIPFTQALPSVSLKLLA